MPMLASVHGFLLQPKLGIGAQRHIPNIQSQGTDPNYKSARRDVINCASTRVRVPNL